MDLSTCGSLALVAIGMAQSRPHVPAVAGDPDAGTARAWTASEAGAAAVDAHERWRLEVGARGLRLAPLDEDRGWTFEIGTVSFGRLGHAVPIALGAPVAAGARVESRHESLSEWFERSPRGLEHGWTIPSAPAGDASRAVWIGLRIGGDLSLHIAGAGQGATLRDARGVLRLRYAHLAAFDAGGGAVPARLVASPEGIGIELDDAGARYPIQVDPLILPAAWVFESDQASASIGSLNAITAGDVDGDGFSDVLVATPEYDAAAGPNDGRVWVYHGGPNGPAHHASPDWIADGGSPSGSFGYSAGSAGDVNGDGFDDVVVTASHGRGKLYVWYGGAAGLGPDGTPGNADFAYESPFANTQFRFSHGACDVNGDGYGDIVAGSLGSTELAWVFFGSASGIVVGASNPWIDPGAPLQAGSQFGIVAVTAGDVNADGYDDIAVGAPMFDVSGPDTGRVFVYHGGPAFAADHTPELVLTHPFNPAVATQFGYALATFGDKNGDGYADFAIGSPLDSTGESQEGHVYFHLGGPGGLSAGYVGGRLEGNFAGRMLGAALAPAGDVDGDGFGDIAVGALGQGASGWEVNLAHGQTAYPSATPGDQTIPVPYGPFASAGVAAAGDVDGDGFGDVLVSAAQYTNGQSSEGAAVLFFGGPDPQNASGHALIEPGPLQSGSPGSRTGHAVSSAGDVNADGYNDVVVGAYEHGGGVGRVQLFLGSSSGPNFASPAWTYVGTTPGEHLGWAVSAGDVDNDGRTDIVVGAPNYASGQVDEGRVYLFRSNAGTLPATPTWTFESDLPGSGLGSSISALGDVNADGFADIAAGGNGYVLLFHGRASALGTLAPASTVSIGDSTSGFGIAVALVGDVNLDGFGDLAVGAHLVDNPQADEGRVYVYLGSYQGISNVIGGQEESQQAGALLGWSVAACGDVNGDGRAEILVGAPGYDAGTSGGAIFLFQALPAGSGVTLSPLSFRTGAQALGQYGYAVSAGGDVNGDGWNDVLVGAPQWDAAGNDNVGRIYLYLGASSGLATSPSETYDGPIVNAHLGESIALGGDVNGDGLSDPIGGVPSANGNDGGVLGLVGGGVTSMRCTTQQRQVSDLQALQILGRSEEVGGFQMEMGVQNGSGNTATAVGREDVRLAYEVRPVGTLLDGTAVQTPGSFVDSGALGSGLRLTRQHSGLNAGISYHWRARIELDNPYMPHTRWTTIQLDGLQEKKLGLSADCNGNGVGDPIDIQTAAPFLCNGSPSSTADCNGNGIPDQCDTASGTSEDCNDNCVPDECEYTPLFDCDLDGVLDECQMPPFGDEDCNANFLVDACDIAAGTSVDTNGDGVPDECQPAGAAYCFGDGTGAACPCGNTSPIGNQEGCLHSLGLGGRLRTSGVPRVTADNYVLLGSQMPNSSALYFQGTTQQSGGNGVVFGDGKRCAAGAVLRLGTKINAGGASQYPVGGDQPISVRGMIPAAGGTRYYQCWYRNAAAFCTASTFNLSNGWNTTWIP